MGDADTTGPAEGPQNGEVEAVDEASAEAPAVDDSRAASSSIDPHDMKPEWFSSKRVPQIVLKRVPQQGNEYDCGLYMLQFIEMLSREHPLPSFATADNLIGYWHPKVFPKDRISEKREKLHRCITVMARANGVDVHPDDDDGEEKLQPQRKKSRGS